MMSERSRVDLEIVSNPEKREVTGLLRPALRRMLCPTLSNAFSRDLNGQPIAVRQDKKEDEKTSKARQALSGLLAECGIDVDSLANPDLSPEEFFNQERKILRYCWKEAHAWEKDGDYFLAVDFRLANLFSPENLAASGLFGDQAGEVAEKMMAFFEAHTGTLDMPAVALIQLDLDQLEKKQAKKIKKQAVKFGNHKSKKALKQKDYVKFNDVFDQAFTAFETAERALDLVHGWTADRWVMFKKSTEVLFSLKALGGNAIAISRSGMGAEETAGWKITEGKKITPFDLAEQLALFNDLTGCWFDYHVFEMHSMGAHAGVYLRHFLNQRLRRHDELLEETYWQQQCQQEQMEGSFHKYLVKVRQSKGRRSQWYQAYKELPESDKKLPFFTMVWRKPALFEANVFTELLALKALFAAEKQPANLKGWESVLVNLSHFPKLARRALEWPLTMVVTNMHLLRETEWPVIWVHVVNAIAEVEVAAAQARGLWEFNDNQKLDVLESLTGLNMVSTMVTISTGDRLVGEGLLHDILGVASGNVDFITNMDLDVTLSGGSVIALKDFGLIKVPLLVVREPGDHYSYKPGLIASFIQLSKRLADYQRGSRQERSLYGRFSREHLSSGPWNILMNSILEYAPRRHEAQDPDAWQAFWLNNNNFRAPIMIDTMTAWERFKVGGSSSVKAGYEAMFPIKWQDLYKDLEGFITQIDGFAYFLVPRKTDNDKKL